MDNFMKTNLLMALMLATALNSGFAEVATSTLAQRAEQITKALEKGPKEGVEAINKAQEGELKVDDSNYIVVIAKEGDVYKRVAHFKKDKLNQSIEPSLLNVVKEAEAKLGEGTGPIAFSFPASDKKMYAVISKQGDLLIFNICPTQEEVDAFLKTSAKVEEKKPEEVPAVPVTPAVEKSEEVKSTTPAETTPEAAKPTTEAEPAKS